MVFSSFPSAACLDPSHWQQQQQQQQQPSRQPVGSSGSLNPHLHPHHLQPPPTPAPPPPPPPPPPPHGPVGGGPNSRPRSMVERARLANIPMPEAALKCPRCESTNTKFCYFNNYNLLQPRHFCKSCRRYWTRGGALRTVPVGGGCRRAKRTKSSSKKMDKRGATADSGGSVSNTSGSNNMLASSDGLVAGNTAELLGLMSQIPPLGFISPIHQPHNHHLGEFTSSKFDPGFVGISEQPLEGISGDLNFQFGEGGDGSHSGGRQQWRVQQFPYMGNPDMQAGLYPIYERGAEPSIVMTMPLTSGLTSTQAASMKTESSNDDNNQVELNMTRRVAGIQGNGMFWGTSGSAWNDLSGFGSQ
ncbi:hypothetical protein MLD38_016071 [Melastoma candidum]|uniref:Uncharacterized protein n=1 Tax=Melastoma candidum TaxID=119954 RepID=A0ACB9RHZ6_9MYRT|nr:hypothetical protein MLD38_016071 [Melastoma candidum]